MRARPVGAWLAAPGSSPATACIATLAAPAFLLDVQPLPGIAGACHRGDAVTGGHRAAGRARRGAWRRDSARQCSRDCAAARPTGAWAAQFAAVASALLLLAVAVPAGALATAGEAARAVGLFGVPTPAGRAGWLAWPALGFALATLLIAVRDRRTVAGLAAVAVLVAVGCTAWLRLLPQP